MKRAILVAVISAISLEASAQDFRIGGEIGLYHDNFEGIASLTALTEVIDADITLFDTVALVAALPFVQLFGDDDGDLEARFRIGNPSFAAYYQLTGDVLKLRIGGGFGIPAAQLPDDEEIFAASIAYGFALAMHGLQGPWLWWPEAIPIMVPSLRIGADIGIVTIDAGADVVIMVPIGDREDLDVFLPVSAGAIVHVLFLGFGARVGAAILPTDDNDKFQLSISPLITATFGPIELEARLTMNIDERFGFAFDEGGIWGFFLGVHAVF